MITFFIHKEEQKGNSNFFNNVGNSLIGETYIVISLKVMIYMVYPLNINKATFLKYPKTLKLILPETHLFWTLSQRLNFKITLSELTLIPNLKLFAHV